MLIEHFKLSEILVTLLELHALSSVILNKFLSLTLDFKLSKALLFYFMQLFAYLVLLLTHLPFQRLCLNDAILCV